MSNPYMGEIRLFSFGFAPKNWALCNGQPLPINQNQALFSLLGTTYGGNGQTTFALPNLQGRMPMHVGAGHVQGESSGSESVTLQANQLPMHTHALSVSRSPGDKTSASGNFPAAATGHYAPGADVALSGNSVTSTGVQPHNNMPPYLVLNFAIALTGIFPTRD